MHKKFYTSIFILLLSSPLIQGQIAVNITPYATGITNHISDIAHNGDGRLYVTEQLGYIRIVEAGGNVLTRPFLDIFNKVTPATVTSTGEQGLLGLAFSPNYATDGFIYVDYTNKTGVGNTVISRFHISPDPDSIDVASEQILLTVTQPFSNHNGGCLKFGNDGYLYISMGDGGSGGDPGDRAQNLAEHLGKILRIDVSGGGAYTVPPSNPFVSTAGALPEIWAYGLRNPWRFSFDRLTHALWIGDVGQSLWEEVDVQPASSAGGENYGWRCYEGNSVYNSTLSCASPIMQTPPVFAYSHATTGGCSITGGYVYRATGQPALFGTYFFADYCNGTIYAINPLMAYDTTIAGVFPGRAFSTFGEDDNGELYVGDLGNGTIYKIVDANTGVRTIDAGISMLRVYAPEGSHDIRLDFSMLKNSEVEITIKDLLGKTVFSQLTSLQQGPHRKWLHPGNLSKGIYLLQLSTATGQTQKKFIR